MPHKSLTLAYMLIFPANEQKAFGTNYGLTAKVAKDAFHLTKGQPKEHAGDNGSGVAIYRHFCDTCGSFILEFGVSEFYNPELRPLLTLAIGECKGSLPLYLCGISR
jgi:hypothetical protein